MAPKSIDIIISARDATGNGVSSARANLERFQQDALKTTAKLQQEAASRSRSLERDILRRSAAAPQIVDDARTARLSRNERELLALEAEHARQRERLIEITRSGLVDDGIRKQAAVELLALQRAQTLELVRHRQLQIDAAFRGVTGYRGPSLSVLGPPPERRSTAQPAPASGTGAGIFGIESQLLRTAGIAAAGRALEGLTRGLVEARDAGMNLGETLQHVSENAIKGIPIAGRFLEAGQNIRELVTGERAALKAANEEIDRQNKLLDQRAALLRESASITVRARQTAADVNWESRVLMALPEQDRSRAALLKHGQDMLADTLRQIEESEKRDRQIGGQVAANGSDATKGLYAQLIAQTELVDKQLAEFDRKQFDARVKASADTDAEIAEQRLRNSGRMIEADIAAIKREYAERIKAARDANEQELADRLEALQQSKIDAANAVRDQQRAQIGDQLVNNQIEALREQAALGDKQAAREAERLAIAQQFTEERRKLNDILKDESATESQRDEARRQLAGMGSREERAQIEAERRANTRAAAGNVGRDDRVFALGAGSGFTGIGDAQRERDRAVTMLKKTEEIAANTKRVFESVDTLNNTIATGTPVIIGKLSLN